MRILFDTLRMLFLGEILIIIGLYCSLCWLFDNLRGPMSIVIGGIKELVHKQTFSEKYGEWAVITGASDGIGKGYARYLARKGMKIVLIARNEEKLSCVAQEITKTYLVQTKIIVANFCDGESIYDHLKEKLNSLDVGILVNNVGLSYNRGMCVEQLAQQALWDLLYVNIAPVTLLSHMLIPFMKQKRRGLIINVSSLSAAAPAPYLTVYAAAKAYVRNFSIALRQELREFQVEVQTVLPGFVHTNMTDFVASDEYKNSGIRKHLVLLDDYIRYAGFTIGKSDHTCGYWTHGLQYAGLKLIPEQFRVFVLQMIYDKLRNGKEKNN
ncbi:inactive hydroxysteroid dehydrogenase-like protein 1 [Anopheles nili]|uniref:inactive hydroxysteroid dehydrogenase-like protein 1 n=1 Tax=Anopheles nili TaxID=185578 RepID=UPI00237BF66E|nr:inactive hydroxysteroid dehydrogenase-like protein 1 [Anopheles nili]